jgi:thiol:disulfide interchange protein
VIAVKMTIRPAVLLPVFAALFLVVSCSLTVNVKAQNEIAWVYDYPTGMKTAAEQNKPVMIYIHEQWCPRCRNMDQNTWNNSEVVNLSASFVNINVLGTEQGTLYNYSKPPLVVFTDPQGKTILKRNEELSASEVAALQRQVLAQAPFKTTPSSTPKPSLSSSASAKAAGVPGFEAILSVASIAVAALVLSQIQQRRH